MDRKEGHRDNTAAPPPTTCSDFDTLKMGETASMHPDYGSHHHNNHNHYNPAANNSNDGNENGVASERPFKNQHHPLIRAIWNVERFNPKLDEKLKDLKCLLKKQNPSILCDILHDVTGQPIAQATPLIIACFEGDPDVIKLLIESCADVNQTESEHHLTPLHVICDAEYFGQSLRVLIKLIFFLFHNRS
jgi:ankyrin repeat protein